MEFAIFYGQALAVMGLLFVASDYVFKLLKGE